MKDDLELGLELNIDRGDRFFFQGLFEFMRNVNISCFFYLVF